MKRPTMVMKPPYRKKTRGSGNNTLYYLCDNDLEYKQYELADAVEMNRKTLASRLKLLGWSHPELLSQKSRRKDQGNREYWRLSTKKRSYNLGNIGVGSFERECFQ